MLSIMLLIGGLSFGGHAHDPFRDNPFMRPPASCGAGGNGACEVPNRDKPPPAPPPVRECPADSSAVTAAGSGERYCLPDRRLRADLSE